MRVLAAMAAFLFWMCWRRRVKAQHQVACVLVIGALLTIFVGTGEAWTVGKFSQAVWLKYQFSAFSEDVRPSKNINIISSRCEIKKFPVCDEIGHQIISDRTIADCRSFFRGQVARITAFLNVPQNSFSAIREFEWYAYPWAIERAFKDECSHGVIVKTYAAAGGAGDEAARRYSPGDVVAVEVKHVVGRPREVSTSYVERQNLSLRMSQRRFTRLTNAFSKKFEHHVAAVALYAMHYNFCRVHEALRITPAMQLGVTDHVWSIGELIDAALDGTLPDGTTTENPMNLDRGDTIQSTRKFGPFSVIDGGKK